MSFCLASMGARSKADNSSVMRTLLRALYRDFVQYPILTAIRKNNGDILDWDALRPIYGEALKRVRFVAIGNPSESGAHILYYFRQENSLSKYLFVDPLQLLIRSDRPRALVCELDHIVFLDDFCGSGIQACQYSSQLLRRLRRLNSSIRLSYFPLFATTAGLEVVRANTYFTGVEAVCELDASFKALDPASRYFREPYPGVTREFASEMCRRYGSAIEPQSPVGFGGCQLLVGFSHNIPDNTLPVFWSEGNSSTRWTPIFRRYSKHEAW